MSRQTIDHHHRWHRRFQLCHSIISLVLHGKQFQQMYFPEEHHEKQFPHQWIYVWTVRVCRPGVGDSRSEYSHFD